LRLSQFDTAIVRAIADETRSAAEAEARAKLGTINTNTRSDDNLGLTYGPAHPKNSFVRDIISASRFGPGSRGAMERLERHQAEVVDLARDDGNPSIEARNARKAMASVSRMSEQRDVTTGAGSLGDFSQPVYALQDFAPWRDYGRTYIDQLHHTPMPDSGMVVYIPRIITPNLAYNQTQAGGENTNPGSQDMQATYASGNVNTFLVQSEVSQQYLDRVGPGINGDAIVLGDQKVALNKRLDAWAWDQTWATVAAQGNFTYYNDTSFKAASWNAAVFAATAAIESSEGTVAYPTHVFTDVNLWASFAGSYDSANRPLVVPQGVAFNPMAVGDPVSNAEGFTGFALSGSGLRVFKDQNLWGSWTGDGAATPGYTNSHPALVADLQIGAEWLEGAPVTRILPQPGAQELTVLIQSFCYAAIVFRYPNAFEGVIGSGTNTPYLI
jgi:hypothetical protein